MRSEVKEVGLISVEIFWDVQKLAYERRTWGQV
jgi:hypothetical protein